MHAIARATLPILLAVSLTGCPGDSTQPSATETTYQPAQGTKVLSVTPIAQQTEVWCWAASAEMIFRYFGLPNLNPVGNYQCGIVAAYYGPFSSCWSNCFSCTIGIGTATALQSVINGYGSVAQQLGVPSRTLSSRVIFSPLSFTDTAREIDQGQPIVAGISPSGYSYPNISQHAVVIVGYQNDSGGQRIIINDPFPYDSFFQQNPYTPAGGTRLAAGRYSVPYASLVSYLNWANTIDQIR